MLGSVQHWIPNNPLEKTCLCYFSKIELLALWILDFRCTQLIADVLTAKSPGSFLPFMLLLKFSYFSSFFSEPLITQPWLLLCITQKFSNDDKPKFLKDKEIEGFKEFIDCPYVTLNALTWWTNIPSFPLITGLNPPLAFANWNNSAFPLFQLFLNSSVAWISWIKKWMVLMIEILWRYVMG